MRRLRALFVTGTALGLGLPGIATSTADAQNRISASETGSALIFSTIELRWDLAGNLIQDSFLRLPNGFPDDVTVQVFIINGDAPTDAVFGPFGEVIERARTGWNCADISIELTQDQPAYFSMSGTQPSGLIPFTALDPGFQPGRPYPENPNEREVGGTNMIGLGTEDAVVRYDPIAAPPESTTIRRSDMADEGMSYDGLIDQFLLGNS